MDYAAANYTAATAHYEAWRSIKMMTDHDTQEHGTEQALARASQGGHTNRYTNIVLEILPKEDVSAIIRESTGLPEEPTLKNWEQYWRNTNLNSTPCAKNSIA